jgi:hypothetical protein
VTLRVLVPALLVAACSGDGASETLEPLPIEGGTAATAASTEPPAPVTASTEVTSTRPPPVGEWDGARFDAGVIETISEVDGYEAIGFDRYSFNDPERGTIDAEAFDEEPVAAWWRESPYVNVRVQARTFILDPDVEILVLAETGRDQACADPPPAQPPAPRWDDADVELLDDPAAAGRIATLTYSPTGQVTRIRFTAGC